MINISRAHAENRFAAIERLRKETLSEQEEMARKIRKNTARLKALRLARDTADLTDSPPKKTGAKKRATKRVAT